MGRKSLLHSVLPIVFTLAITTLVVSSLLIAYPCTLTKSHKIVPVISSCRRF